MRAAKPRRRKPAVSEGIDIPRLRVLSRRAIVQALTPAHSGTPGAPAPTPLGQAPPLNGAYDARGGFLYMPPSPRLQIADVLGLARPPERVSISSTLERVGGMFRAPPGDVGRPDAAGQERQGARRCFA
jgi:hypothetical protein